MSIVRASLTPFRLPMQWPLETARGVTRVREGLLVELRGRGELRGYGEAMPLPGFGLESLAESRAALASALPALLGLDAEDLEIDVLCVSSEQAVSHPATDEQGLPAAGPHPLGDQCCQLEFSHFLGRPRQVSCGFPTTMDRSG